MRKVLGSLLALMLMLALACSASAAEIKSFDDVPQTHWAYEDIMTCVEKGAISGTRTPDENGVGSFAPDAKVSVGQFLTVISRLLCPEMIREMELSWHWALSYYTAAVDAGIIKSTIFMPTSAGLDTAISREDMAYVLVGAAAYNGETLKKIDGMERAIVDYDAVDFERRTDVLKCYSNGLLAGYDNGDFAPGDSMTRAQMATVVCRLMGYAPRLAVEGAPNELESKSYYVVGTGYNKGLLKPAYSREKELEALSLIKLGEDEKGVYVVFTAPELPDVIKDDFTFTFDATPYKANGDYFTMSCHPDGVKQGESVTLYLEGFWGEMVRSSDIAVLSLAVMINDSTGYRNMFVRSIESSHKDTANASWNDGSIDFVSFDSTAIFAPLGL